MAVHGLHKKSAGQRGRTTGKQEKKKTSGVRVSLGGTSGGRARSAPPSATKTTPGSGESRGRKKKPDEDVHRDFSAAIQEFANASEVDDPIDLGPSLVN